MALRNGLAIATEIAKHLCRLLATFRPAMTVAIDAAVTGGKITTTQRDILNTWLDGAQTACNVLRSVTGY